MTLRQLYALETNLPIFGWTLIRASEAEATVLELMREQKVRDPGEYRIRRYFPEGHNRMCDCAHPQSDHNDDLHCSTCKCRDFRPVEYE